MFGTKFLPLTVFLLSFYRASSRTVSNEDEIQKVLADLTPLLSSLHDIPDVGTSIKAHLQSELTPSSPEYFDWKLPEGGKKGTRLNQDIIKSLADSIIEKIDALVKEAAVKVEDLQDRTNCIRRSVMSAREEATQGILEVGKCVLNSTTKANDAIQPVITNLHTEIMKLGPLVTKLISDIVACRKVDYPLSCLRDTLMLAEKQVRAIGDEIRENLKAASQTWNNLLQELRKCFHGGTVQVTTIEKELRLEILDCLE